MRANVKLLQFNQEKTWEHADQLQNIQAQSHFAPARLGLLHGSMMQAAPNTHARQSSWAAQ
jgi:hypothetical protein